MEEAITLYISGHGKEDINEKFINNNYVELLSFVGKPGEFGLMKFCKNYNNQPIDIVTINYLHEQYNQGNINNDVQSKIFQNSTIELPIIYKNCNIVYNDGFTITWPRFEREFIFEPAPHENCRICSNNCDNGRCLPKRNINEICCPEYGLTVVTSSYKSDIPYTLGGTDNRLLANLNLSLPAKAYWKNRSSVEYRYLIDQIYDEKFIHLTDLFLLFTSMGFKHIYIYDPTCRDCEINVLQAQENRNLELTKPIITQPLNSNPLPNYNQNSNNKNYINDCINGICNVFQKSKVSGGNKKSIRKNNKKSIRKNKKKSIKTNNKKNNI